MNNKDTVLLMDVNGDRHYATVTSYSRLPALIAQYKDKWPHLRVQSVTHEHWIKSGAIAPELDAYLLKHPHGLPVRTDRRAYLYVFPAVLIADKEEHQLLQINIPDRRVLTGLEKLDITVTEFEQ